MACGTPVLASKRGALPEVGGDAALYFDPGSTENIREIIEAILLDEASRKRLSSAGISRSKGFSWEMAARRTLIRHMKKPADTKIKILHVSATSTGGVGLNLLMLARHMNKERFELSFAIPQDSHFFDEIAKEGVTIFPLQIDRNPLRLKNIIGFFRLWKIIRETGCTIVHTHTSVGGIIGRLAARLNRTPLILWTIHGWAFDYPYGGSTRRKFFLMIEKYMDRFTDHYVAISENMKEVGVKAGITDNGKTDVIHHGIELKEYSMQLIRNGMGIKNDGDIIIGTAGRLEPQKAVDALIRAVGLVKDRYPRIKLLIVGDGPLRGNLESLAGTLGMGDNIIFTGWKPDALDYIACMDIFCLSSLWEGFGIVLLEAMSMGKPIVATKVGGVPEIVMEGKGGILVSPRKPDELAAGILHLFGNPEIRKEMGCFNKGRVNTMFGLKTMIEKYEVMYERLFNKLFC